METSQTIVIVSSIFAGQGSGRNSSVIHWSARGTGSETRICMVLTDNLTCFHFHQLPDFNPNRSAIKLTCFTGFSSNAAFRTAIRPVTSQTVTCFCCEERNPEPKTSNINFYWEFKKLRHNLVRLQKGQRSGLKLGTGSNKKTKTSRNSCSHL